MSVGNVSNGWTERRQYTTDSRKTESKDTFADKVQKAADSQEAAVGAASIWPGDMVLQQPPGYFDFMCTNDIPVNKSKEDMTMDEYKLWVRNEIAQMPVSNWYRSTCAGGVLIITQEAFERMKSDPEWERTVLNMVRQMYSTEGISGSKMVGYQVIGASPQECYGAGIPIKDTESEDEKSWWKKRHERYEEMLEEQLKAARKRLHAQREETQQAALVEHLKSQQLRQNLLKESLLREKGIVSMSPFLYPAGVNAAAMAAYEGTIGIFSDVFTGAGE